jgi:hypothetical protein
VDFWYLASGIGGSGSWWHRPRDQGSAHRCLPTCFHCGDRFFCAGPALRPDGRALRTFRAGPRTPSIDRAVARHDERARTCGRTLVAGAQGGTFARARARASRQPDHLRPRTTHGAVGTTAHDTDSRTDGRVARGAYRVGASRKRPFPRPDPVGAPNPVSELPRTVASDRHRKPRGLSPVWSTLLGAHRRPCGSDGGLEPAARRDTSRAARAADDLGRDTDRARRPSLAGVVRGLGERETDPVPEVSDPAPPSGRPRV